MNIVAKILIEAIKAENRRMPTKTLYNNHKHPKRIRKELFDLLSNEIRHGLEKQDRGHCSINTTTAWGELPSMWVWGRLVIPKDK